MASSDPGNPSLSPFLSSSLAPMHRDPKGQPCAEPIAPQSRACCHQHQHQPPADPGPRQALHDTKAKGGREALGSVSQRGPGLGSPKSPNSLDTRTPPFVLHGGSPVTLCGVSPIPPHGPDLQDSDLSRLIDQVALSLGSEPGSSISALLGDQLDETQGLEEEPSQAPVCPPRSCPQDLAGEHADAESSAPSTFPIPCTSPKSAAAQAEPQYSARAVGLSSSSLSPRAVEGALPTSTPTRFPGRPSPAQPWDRTPRGGLVEASLCFCSVDSSLVEVETDLENLSLSAGDSARQGLGPLASPLGPRPRQEQLHKNCGAAGMAQGLQGTQDPSTQACTGCHGAECGHDPRCHIVSTRNGVWGPVSRWCPRPPAPVLSSPCKSKSLGDLTSEDIACNFESKYQCISRSFVATGLRAQRGTNPSPRAPEGGPDALTEQLRRLVTLEQEDTWHMLGTRQESGVLPRALVRKLSSRSQSRVRNIASRAKERQDAGRQRGAGGGPAVGAAVVLRSKPGTALPLGARHSTGSYIAGYLGAKDVEGRGVPEGCAALRPGRLHPLCTQSASLPAEPGSADKAEIYFLLRL